MEGQVRVEEEDLKQEQDGEEFKDEAGDGDSQRRLG